MIKRVVMISIVVISILLCSKLEIQVGGTGHADNILTDHSFIDDMGNEIIISQPVRTIVSLSPTHTENLFYIGAGFKVMAVDVSSIFPYEAAMLTRYRLNKAVDIENLIASNPDVVLIEPSLNRNQTMLVSALEVAGLKVISLMPESMDDFDGYIRKLGIISGEMHSAEMALENFHETIEAFQVEQSNINKLTQGVFIETSERGYQTVTSTSLEGQAVVLAGGKLITPKLSWYTDDAMNRVVSGLDFIESHKESIHVYLSLQGDGNTGASLVSMRQKPLFSHLKAMSVGRVYEINSPIIGRYNFRYLQGVKEVNRMLYGTSWHYTDDWNGDEVLTREVFAKVVYDALLLPTYTMVKKDYYDYEKFHHTYGAFEDVTYRDDDFSIIETVVMKSYLLPVKHDDVERFNRQQIVTAEELEAFIYIWQDLRGEALKVEMTEVSLDIEAINTVSDLINLLEYFTGEQVEE